MVDKNNYGNSGSEGFDTKEYSGKSVLNKHEYDLFDEEKYCVEKVVRIKRVNTPNKGERWRITEDNKVAFTIESAKISKKEKEFLRTADGFNFLIHQFKSGIKSLNKLRIELKKRLKK